jgi:hypothetical protein
LIEVMREANSRIDYAKIIIALRVDLFERVLRATSDAGFQDEKYRNLTLPVNWESQGLIEVLDKRVNALVRLHYAGNQDVSLRDVLPASIGKPRQRGIDYLIDRTLLRPRDAIAFFNTCMRFADGDPVVGANKLIDAEAIYSDQRLQSLADEWSVQYPKLLDICEILRDRSNSFNIRDWNMGHLDELCLAVFENNTFLQGEDISLLDDYYRNRISRAMLRKGLAMILYRTGIVGLRVRRDGPVRWAYDGRPEVPASALGEGTSIHVHKMLWHTLGIRM